MYTFLDLVALERAVGFPTMLVESAWSLTSESVQGASLTFQSVDHVHSSDGLPLGVLAVGDCVADDVFQENFQHTASLFVDQPGDSLHSTSTSQSADGGLGDALDIVAEHLSVTLGTSLSQSFASFTTSRHASSLLLHTKMKFCSDESVEKSILSSSIYQSVVTSGKHTFLSDKKTAKTLSPA